MFLCCLPKSWRRRSNAPSPMILPNELYLEILSFLSVKTLTRLRSVSKSWNTLISDPTFVKMHLKRSPRNPHLAVLMWRSTYGSDVIAALPVRRLLKNRSITIMDKYTVCYRYNSSGFKVVGSCNGLVCLLLYCINKTCTDRLCFWNPATKTRSEKTLEKVFYSDGFRLAFGYDNSKGTYKVVVFRVFKDVDYNNHGQWTSDVRVFNLVDNSSWRNIQSFPAVPLNHLDRRNDDLSNDGVHLSSTLNWLALRNVWSSLETWNDRVSVEQFVIVSLDLSTETYTELLLPRGFNELPRGFEDQLRPVQPTIIHVLMDCLCFCHDSKGTEFVIWQMKEFGVRESWTQLLKVCYQNLQLMNYDAIDFQVLPLCLSENGDTVILKVANQGYFYYWRVNRVEGARILNGCQRIFEGKDYIQSLVSPP